MITPATESVGLVYIIRAGERVKIGWCAGNVEKRRSELQTGCPDRLEVVVVFPGSRAEEADCHRRFTRDRCDEGGQEWFRLSDDIQEFIVEQQRIHADLQLSIENGARYRALWSYYARWPWDVLDKKGRRSDTIPESLSADDIHRAIMTFDSRPVRLTRMIQALDSGETSVPESERGEWPVIVLMTYLDVEPDPLDRRAMNRLFDVYHPQSLEVVEQVDRAYALRRFRELKAEQRAKTRG